MSENETLGNLPPSAEVQSAATQDPPAQEFAASAVSEQSEHSEQSANATEARATQSAPAAESPPAAATETDPSMPPLSASGTGTTAPGPAVETVAAAEPVVGSEPPAAIGDLPVGHKPTIHSGLTFAEVASVDFFRTHFDGHRLHGIVAGLASAGQSMGEVFTGSAQVHLPKLLEAIDWLKRLMSLPLDIGDAASEKQRVLAALAVLRVWANMVPSLQSFDLVNKLEHWQASSAAVDGLTGMVHTLRESFSAEVITPQTINAIMTGHQAEAFRSAELGWEVIVPTVQAVHAILLAVGSKAVLAGAAGAAAAGS